MQQQIGNIETSPSDTSQEELIIRIGNLTRTLRRSIRELGLDTSLQKAAEAVPDARDRLHYIANMTEQAADRVLNAGEMAQPMQTAIQNQALALIEKRKIQGGSGYVGMEVELDQFLADVNTKSRMTNELLIDMMLAQGFQDLTGQVINKLMDVVGIIEKELLQVLVDHLPEASRQEVDRLLNGPQMNSDRPDVVSNQDQVDDILASLGY